MTTRDESPELRLERLWQVDLPDELASEVDQRVQRALAERAVAGQRALRRSSPRLGSSLIVGLVASVLLAAAAYGFGIFDRLIGENPGWQQAWSQAVELNLPVAIGSDHLVVARAYADANQVLVGVTSPDLRDLLADAGPVSLTDSAGRSYEQSSAASAPQDGGSIGLFTFVSATDLTPGPQQFTLSGSGAHPWRVEFGVTVRSTSLEPGTRISTDQFRFALKNVTIGASTVRVALDVALQPSGDASRAWAPISHLVHDGHTIGIWGGPTPDMGIGTHTLFSDNGANDPSGDWQLVITEMVGVAGDGSQVRIPINKALEFWVP